MCGASWTAIRTRRTSSSRVCWGRRWAGFDAQVAGGVGADVGVRLGPAVVALVGDAALGSTVMASYGLRFKAGVLIAVVPVEPEHVNGLRRAIESVVREGGLLAMAEVPTLVEVIFFVERLKRAGCPQVVALDGKRVVGWCDVRPHATREDVGVLGIGVVAGFRRSGLGSRLLEACLAASRFRTVELQVLASNAAALAFYVRHGFEEPAPDGHDGEGSAHREDLGGPVRHFRITR